MTRGFFVRLATTTMLVGGATTAATAQDNIFDVFGTGDPPQVRAWGVSDDGTIVIGEMGSQAMRLDLTSNPLGPAQIGGQDARAISGDGSMIVGYQAIDSDSFAVRWRGDGTGMTQLDTTLPGDAAVLESWAYGVSDDGGVIAGVARDANDLSRFAVRWSGDDLDLEALGGIPVDRQSIALGVSGDGATIVGSHFDVEPEINGMAFAWTAAGGLVTLDPLGDGTSVIDVSAIARAADQDGDVIVGTIRTGPYPVTQAVRWVDGGTPESLGSLAGPVGISEAWDVSDDGAVIVGQTQVIPGLILRAMRYTDVDGMETVEGWLRRNGVVIGQDITRLAHGVSADGSVVVGAAEDDRMFIARGPAASGGGDPGGGDPGGGDPGGGDPGGGDPGGGDPGGGDPGGGDPGGGDPGGGSDPEPGMIMIDDLSQSLADAGATSSAVVSNFNTLLNGAGSRPLDRRADPEGSIFWATGDLGRADHGAQDGGFGLGEIGVGRSFGAVQLNAAFGASRQVQNTAFEGETRVNSLFAKLEGMSMLYGDEDSGLWAVLTGAGARGTAETGRNYLANGSLVVSSSGSTDVSGYGVRGRLQWDNAFAHTSPFAELSWSRACVDGYAESGGPFPATFDRQCGSETLARYGGDASVPVTDRVRVTATLQGVHRIGGSPGETSGQVTGLGTFNLAVPSDDDFWARGGVGFETDLGSASMLSVTVNATTQGSAPSGWFSASWRKRF